jgi:hypothetical protein
MIATRPTIFLALLLLCSMARAQSIQLFRYNSQFYLKDLSTGITRCADPTQVTLSFYPKYIRIEFGQMPYEVTPEKLLDVNGNPYGTTLNAAISAWKAAYITNDTPTVSTAPISSSIVNWPVVTSMSGSVTATISNPATDYSTSALQGAGNATLGSIDNKTPVLGQTTGAGSVPVVIASNQSPVPVSVSAVPLASGAATDRTLPTAPFSVRLSDGNSFATPVNIRPLTTADVVTANQGGAWNVGLGAGTNNIGNVNQTPAVRGYAAISDGANTMPTMDAATRAGFFKLTDGTNNMAVKPASAPAVAGDPAAVVTYSPNGIAVPINQTQKAGTAISLGNGVTATNTERVTLSSDGPGFVAATGGTGVTQAMQIAGRFNATLPTLTSGQSAQAQVDANGRLYVILTPVRSAAVQSTLSITVGGTAQVALAANVNRNGWEIHNSSTGPLYFSIGGTAVVGLGYLLPSGGYYRQMEGAVVATSAISIIGATLGQTFTVTTY